MFGLDVCGILDDTAGELGEGFAEFVDTLSLHFEMTLLGHRGIPAVVRNQYPRVTL